MWKKNDASALVLYWFNKEMAQKRRKKYITDTIGRTKSLGERYANPIEMLVKEASRKIRQLFGEISLLENVRTFGIQWALLNCFDFTVLLLWGFFQSLSRHTRRRWSRQNPDQRRRRSTGNEFKYNIA